MIRFARMCFNWKVLVTLAGVGVLVWVAASNLVLRALPLLLLAACPLSMLFMMRGMQGGDMHSTHGTAQSSPTHSSHNPKANVEELEAMVKELQEDITRLKGEPDALETSNNRRNSA